MVKKYLSVDGNKAKAKEFEDVMRPIIQFEINRLDRDSGSGNYIQLVAKTLLEVQNDCIKHLSDSLSTNKNKNQEYLLSRLGPNSSSSKNLGEITSEGVNLYTHLNEIIERHVEKRLVEDRIVEKTDFKQVAQKIKSMRKSEVEKLYGRALEVSTYGDEVYKSVDDGLGIKLKELAQSWLVEQVNLKGKSFEDAMRRVLSQQANVAKTLGNATFQGKGENELNQEYIYNKALEIVSMQKEVANDTYGGAFSQFYSLADSEAGSDLGAVLQEYAQSWLDLHPEIKVEKESKQESKLFEDVMGELKGELKPEEFCKKAKEIKAMSAGKVGYSYGENLVSLYRPAGNANDNERGMHLKRCAQSWLTLHPKVDVAPDEPQSGAEASTP